MNILLNSSYFVVLLQIIDAPNYSSLIEASPYDSIKIESEEYCIAQPECIFLPSLNLQDSINEVNVSYFVILYLFITVVEVVRSDNM